MKNFLFVCVAMAFCLGLQNTSLNARELECSPKFDQNKNGLIDKGREIEVCGMHGGGSPSNQVMSMFDSNADGKLDVAELKSLYDDARFQSTAEVFDTNEIIGAAPGLRPTVPPTPEKEEEENTSRFATKEGIILRNAFQTVGVLNTPTLASGKRDLSKISGADFSFTNNSLTGEHDISASGALMFFRQQTLAPLKASDNVDYSSLGGIVGTAIYGGAEFDRKINTANRAAETNSLSLKAGGEVQIRDVQNRIDHYFSGAVFDNTDFDFKAHVLGGQISYQPVSNRLAIGVARKIGSLPVYFRWHPSLRGEYQYVLDDGDRSNLVQSDSYVFAGPVVSATFWFDNFLDNFYIDTNYWYMQDVGAGNQTFTYYDVSGNFNLDPDGHVALTAKYRNGRLPTDRQRVEDFRVGLTAKF